MRGRRRRGLPYPHVDSQAGNEYAGWQILVAAVNATKSLDDAKLAALARHERGRHDRRQARLQGQMPHQRAHDRSRSAPGAESGNWVTVWPAGGRDARRQADRRRPDRRRWHAGGSNERHGRALISSLLDQALITGILTGGLYGLLALGLSLSWGLLAARQSRPFRDGAAGRLSHLVSGHGDTASRRGGRGSRSSSPSSSTASALHWVFMRFARHRDGLDAHHLRLRGHRRVDAPGIWTADFRRYETAGAASPGSSGSLYVPKLNLVAFLVGGGAGRRRPGRGCATPMSAGRCAPAPRTRRSPPRSASTIAGCRSCSRAFAPPMPASPACSSR